MYYVDVFVADSSYQKSSSLTYSSEESLQAGSIVTVPFKNKEALGLVTAVHNTKPSFATKPVSAALPEYILPQTSLNLHAWMCEYYPKSTGSITGLFVQKALYKRFTHKEPLAIAPAKNRPLPSLTAEQKAALKEVNHSGTYIVHGETGSGKTRLYAELAKKALSHNRSVLLLVPEIGLTTPIAQEVANTLQTHVYIAHSNQLETQRRALWHHLATTQEACVVVAPRSGLFLPFTNLGLLVLDEFHDSSYKHEQPPHFSSTKVAAFLSKLHDAQLILGSATPSLEDYFLAQQKEAPVLRLTKTAIQSNHKVAIHTVDLKNRSLFSRNRYVSDLLLKEVRQALDEKKQSLILLNRRGSARVTLCENCDWLATCPKCETPLTFHADLHQLRCHTCGFKTPAPASCPMCKSVDIAFKSIGTKSLETFFKTQFPAARIARYDADTHKDDKLEASADKLKNGDIDILIGTQMLAKGLDLPNLKIVGVIVADSGLFFPDFTAREKTFQLLYQVIGRVGRGHNDGTVIIQTYSPKSDIIKQSLERNWDSFYNAELADRKTFFLPPFCYMLKLTIRRKTLKSAEENALKIAAQITSSYPSLKLIGPGPAFIEKQAGNHVWQLVVRSTKRKLLVEIINKLPSNIQFDIDPSDLL